MEKRFLLVLVLLVTGCLQQGDVTTRKGKLVVSSAAFPFYGTIPPHYTCDGENVNPPLMIECIPEGTTSLALTVEDTDANIGSWVHWVLFNVSPTELIEENTAPGVVGTNDFGLQSYNGPCPLSREHTFDFQVYALDIFLNLNSDATREDITRAMEGHILAEGELKGIYCNNSRYSMDVTPLKIRVKRGESAEFQIHTVFCNPAFSHNPVSFLIRGLHSSMEWHITPGYTLVVDSSSETPPGIYWLKIMGEARGCSRISYAALIIEGNSQDNRNIPRQEAVLPEVQDTVSSEDWTQFSGNAQHTSFSPIEVPETLEILWNYKVSPPGGHRRLCPQTAPALVDDKVYILICTPSPV
ncbi:MAG: YbhB/YbcL family Raf kinase inhibitor-like protein [Theionarchaea archaeon]|nr:YbhB/YbcL family Raf kinase inhibitor-like protein [Theionarchaea archaeon]